VPSADLLQPPSADLLQPDVSSIVEGTFHETVNVSSGGPAVNDSISAAARLAWEEEDRNLRFHGYSGLDGGCSSGAKR